jgi:hypothetical protein
MKYTDTASQFDDNSEMLSPISQFSVPFETTFGTLKRFMSKKMTPYSADLELMPDVEDSMISPNSYQPIPRYRKISKNARAKLEMAFTEFYRGLEMIKNYKVRKYCHGGLFQTL